MIRKLNEGYDKKARWRIQNAGYIGYKMHILSNLPAISAISDILYVHTYQRLKIFSWSPQ